MTFSVKFAHLAAVANGEGHAPASLALCVCVCERDLDIDHGAAEPKSGAYPMTQPERMAWRPGGTHGMTKTGSHGRGRERHIHTWGTHGLMHVPL